MTSRFDSALAALRSACGLSAESIERCDVGKDGALTLEARAGAERRWFRFDGTLRELRPELDRELPLCASLRDRPDAEPVTVLAWRPGRRIALAVGDGANKHVQKGLRKGRAGAVAERHRRFHRGIVSRDIGVDAPEVLRVDEAAAALSMSWLPAPPARIRAHAHDVWRQVGLAVRSMQELVGGEGLAKHGPSEELGVLDRMAGRYAHAHSALPAGWQQQRERLQVALVDTQRPVLIHGDLHDGQLVSGGGRIGVLDLDGIALGDANQDLANLTVHLELRALSPGSGVTEADAAACNAALLEGAGGFDTDSEFCQLRAFQASTFLRLALIYGLRPRWHATALGFVPLAKRCLDDIRPLSHA